MKKVNKVNEQQRVVVVSADVTVAENVVRAFDEAKIKMGRDPDMIFACAGAAFPKQFLDHSMQDFEYLARLNYLGQAYVAHVSLPVSIEEKEKRTKQWAGLEASGNTYAGFRNQGW